MNSESVKTAPEPDGAGAVEKIVPIKDLNDFAAFGAARFGKHGKPVFVPGRAAAPATFDPMKTANDLRLWALAGKDKFFQEVVGTQTSEWVEVGVETLRLILRDQWVRQKVGDGEIISQTDQVILYLHRHRRIELAMKACAGWPQGIHRTQDRSQVLIRTERHPVNPEKGEFPTISELLNAKLGDEQLPYFLGWLKSAMESYRDDTPGRFRPSQVVILIGEPSTGKNFTQLYVITPLLGRVGDPTEWLLNAQTSFNSDWFGKEHLTVCDPPGGGDKRIKKIFGSKLKSLAANECHRFHAKGKDAELMQPKFVVTISANKNYHSRAILPYVLASDMRDKLLVFAWNTERGPLPIHQNEREAFCQKIMSELPAFAHHVLNEFQIPGKIEDRFGRFAVNGYCEPSLAEIFLSELPSHELLILIRQARQGSQRMWDSAADVKEKCSSGEWLATHDYIRRWLEDSSVSEQAERFFKQHDNVGNLLSGLSDILPGLCRSDRTSSKRFWRFSIGDLEA